MVGLGPLSLEYRKPGILANVTDISVHEFDETESGLICCPRYAQ